MAFGTPVTRLKKEGDYSVEVIFEALRYRNIDSVHGDLTCLEKLDGTDAVIAGNGKHWTAMVFKETKWWHVEKAYCVPIANLKTFVRSKMNRNGMFIAIHNRARIKEESTQSLLLRVQSAVQTAPVLSILERQDVGKAEDAAATTDDRSGDPFMQDAPSAKRSRTEEWRDYKVGRTVMLANKDNTRYKCPVSGCAFENEKTQSLVAHIARHRSSGVTTPSQDLLAGSTAEDIDVDNDFDDGVI